MPNIFGITITVGPAIAGIIWLLEHPEIYDRVKASIVKPFMRRRERLQKIYIASDIQAKINSFSKEISKEIGEKEKYKIKIQWVKNSNIEAFLTQDELIIKMDCAENLNRNLVLVTLKYISKTLIPKSRPYIDKDLNEPE